MTRREPIGTWALVARGLAGAVASGAIALATVAVLGALKALREVPGAGFDLGPAIARILRPESIAEWTELGGIAAFAAVGGLFAAAVAAARRRL